MHDIRTELSKRILILDGAMGTMLQRKGLQGNSESFNLTNPETIGEIHNEYIEAGADIITTNSFSANSISQSEYNLSDKAGQMAEAAARSTRSPAKPPMRLHARFGWPEASGLQANPCPLPRTSTTRFSVHIHLTGWRRRSRFRSEDL